MERPLGKEVLAGNLVCALAPCCEAKLAWTNGPGSFPTIPQMLLLGLALVHGWVLVHRSSFISDKEKA